MSSPSDHLKKSLRRKLGGGGAYSHVVNVLTTDRGRDLTFGRKQVIGFSNRAKIQAREEAKGAI